MGMSNKHLILDNYSIHNRVKEELVEDAGHKLVFMTSYARFLNPIGKGMGNFKGKVKKVSVKTDQELWNKSPPLLPV